MRIANVGHAAAVASLVAILACGATPGDGGVGSTTGAMSSTIHSVYGLTSFGGAGDCQSVACGGPSSCDTQPWYSASSQRYGCHVHLQVTANGRCVVVETIDSGPASYVESDANIAILDASPSVAQYLFGVSSLGWSDNKDNPGEYEVHVSVTSAALGPCDGASSGGSNSSGGSAGSGGSEGSGGSASSGAGGGAGAGGGDGAGGGVSCSSDGDCNTGSDGSGQICVQGQCVAGCNADWECPGNTTCVSGSCQ